MTLSESIEQPDSRSDKNYWVQLTGKPSRRSTHGRGHRWIAPSFFISPGRMPDVAHPTFANFVRHGISTWDRAAVCANRSGGVTRCCTGYMLGRENTLQVFANEVARDNFLLEPEPFPDHGLSWP